MADQMTQAQIDSISDPAIRAQVQALLNERNTLAGKVKEKSPTWTEIAPYGKGVAGVQVSSKGQVQITGTRKAYGGLFLFKNEILLILANHEKFSAWMTSHDADLMTKEKEAQIAAAKKEADEAAAKLKQTQGTEEQQQQQEGTGEENTGSETPPAS